MSAGGSNQAAALERLERLEELEDHLHLELLNDGRIRAQKPNARELLRDRLSSAEILPTGPGWAVFRSHVAGPPRELLGMTREVVAAGTLNAGGWSIVDLVSFLANSGQTGVLSVVDDAKRSVYFHRGDVVWASSSVPPDRFGAFLLSRGKITREQLHAAVRDGPAGMGRACVERGYLAPEELEPMVRAFMAERFGALLKAEQGLWLFARIDEAPLAQAPIRLPTQALMVEGLRRLDEMRIYRQRVRSAETMIKRSPRWSRDLLGDAREMFMSRSPELPGQAETILRALPGAASIQELVRRTGQGEFEVTRTVYHLLRADLVSAVSVPQREVRVTETDTDPKDVINIYGLALSEMMDELRYSGRAPEILAAVNAFLEAEDGVHRELLSELQLDAEGRLDPDVALASFEASNASCDDLIDALAELLFFALMRASEVLGRRRGDDLARRVRLIHGMLGRSEDASS